MEPIKNEYQSYLEFKEAQYFGYKVKGSKEFLLKLNKSKAELDRCKEILNEKVKINPYGTDTIIAQGNYDSALANYEELNKALMTGSVFVDQSVENCPYIPSENDFSIGDLVGRQTINANRVRVPMDNYNDTNVAQEVKEGESSEMLSLTDSLKLLNTETTDAIIFDDILATTGNVYDDDKEVMDAAFDSVHKKHLINAENKKAFEILSGSKNAIAVSAENVQNTINNYLCGKAKRNAVIITNKSGFAKLDIDINGISLITKVTTDKMVYKSKYEIIEMPDEILPNTENGSPIIIGDIAHVLKFYIIWKDSLFKHDIYPYTVADRQIKKEIIALTTTSDEAYIIGYLA